MSQPEPASPPISSDTGEEKAGGAQVNPREECLEAAEGPQNVWEPEFSFPEEIDASTDVGRTAVHAAASDTDDATRSEQADGSAPPTERTNERKPKSVEDDQEFY